ncbi:MAG TPA: hypothetical protein VFJ30_18440 [Phycisphaerae bacterium]|nr:hypothetical protein [Phycisphaerae bacterium]
MIGKAIKIGIIVLGASTIVGVAAFGTDLFSYVSSSARTMRTAVKDSVPIEFELRRASDLLDEIVPEMQANIRLIAQEEVELASLKEDIARSEDGLKQAQTGLASQRQRLTAPNVEFVIYGQRYSRQEVKEDLARRLDRVREAEVILAGKQRLLTAREQSLRAAMEMLAKTRGRKSLLEEKVSSLAAQHRLVKAASAGSQFQVDNSKLAQAEKLIQSIRKRLDVAERVLAHEARFTETIPVDTVSEGDLLTEVDEYLDGGQQGASATALTRLDPPVETAP